MYKTENMPMVNTHTIGTFSIRGNIKKGYWIEDMDAFNNWGVKNSPDGSNFKTRQAACDFAQRCHDFKVGRRMSV